MSHTGGRGVCSRRSARSSSLSPAREGSCWRDVMGRRMLAQARAAPLGCARSAAGGARLRERVAEGLAHGLQLVLLLGEHAGARERGGRGLVQRLADDLPLAELL